MDILLFLTWGLLEIKLLWIFLPKIFEDMISVFLDKYQRVKFLPISQIFFVIDKVYAWLYKTDKLFFSLSPLEI